MNPFTHCFPSLSQNKCFPLIDLPPALSCRLAIACSSALSSSMCCGVSALIIKTWRYLQHPRPLPLDLAPHPLVRLLSCHDSTLPQAPHLISGHGRVHLRQLRHVREGRWEKSGAEERRKTCCCANCIAYRKFIGTSDKSGDERGGEGRRKGREEGIKEIRKRGGGARMEDQVQQTWQLLGLCPSPHPLSPWATITDSWRRQHRHLPIALPYATIAPELRTSEASGVPALPSCEGEGFDVT
eukprot:768455-Hanusia_phi.AAC.17